MCSVLKVIRKCTKGHRHTCTCPWKHTHTPQSRLHGHVSSTSCKHYCVSGDSDHWNLIVWATTRSALHGESDKQCCERRPGQTLSLLLCCDRCRLCLFFLIVLETSHPAPVHSARAVSHYREESGQVRMALNRMWITYINITLTLCLTHQRSVWIFLTTWKPGSNLVKTCKSILWCHCFQTDLFKCFVRYFKKARSEIFWCHIFSWNVNCGDNHIYTVAPQIDFDTVVDVLSLKDSYILKKVV